MSEKDVLQSLADKMESEIRPLLRQSKYDHPPGYDCCGCGTYDEILDHAIKLVQEAEAEVSRA